MGCLEKEQRDSKRLRTEASELKALLEAHRMAHSKDDDGHGFDDIPDFQRRGSAVSSASGYSKASSCQSASTLGDELRDAESDEDFGGDGSQSGEVKDFLG